MLRDFSKAALVALVLACCSAAGGTQSPDPEALWRNFVSPPADARPMVRWWWFGPAVDDREIEREIRAMKAGGFGGFEIQPVYPLTPDGGIPGVRNTPFLSPSFLASLGRASDIASAENMRLDLTLGSGWPFGGPHIGIDQAASQLRMERRPIAAGETELLLPAPGPGESLVAAMVGPVTADPKAGRALVPLSIDNARVKLVPRNRPREALIFIAGRTGQQVKRPALGAEGFVLDHLDPTAVANHLSAVGGPLLSAFAGRRPPYAIFSDSLEAYGSNWTPDLPAEFRKRRGYDLVAHLPALFLDTPNSGDIRYDWALTMSELVGERYLTVLDKWARDRGTRFRAQVYGIPPVMLSSNARIALPEGEGAPWRSFTSTRWATSAAHLYDRPVVSSEVWTWLHSPSWAATPLDMKVEADRHFLQGVTQLIGHGWPYSPPGAPEPGWAFYAAAALSDRNPWYAAMPDVTRYLQRVSYILRQGQPANSVAIYLPTEDAMAGMRPERASINEWVGEHLPREIVPQVIDGGYGFDFIDGPAIVSRGIRHRLVLIPSLSRIDAAAYGKIVRWAEQGGSVIVVDRWPRAGGGLLTRKSDSAAVSALSRRLARQRNVRLTDLKRIGTALAAAATPDMRLATPDSEIGMVHRKLGASDIYFLVNSSNLPVATTGRFAGDRGNGSWWDPMTARRWGAGTGDVDIQLAPYESRILSFGGPAIAAQPEPTGSFIPLTQGWTLKVAGQPGRPIANFRSWTENPALRYFSGTATYRTTIRVDRTAGRCIALDFGQPTAVAPTQRRNQGAALATPIRDAAILFVNGRRAGAVWAPPYRLDISDFVRPGDNTIEVQVSNTAINQLAGHPREDFRLLTARYGERFQMQDQDRIAPAPSGLLGGVSLITTNCG